MGDRCVLIKPWVIGVYIEQAMGDRCVLIKPWVIGVY